MLTEEELDLKMEETKFKFLIDLYYLNVGA